MAALSTSKLVLRRVRHSRMLLASVFVGILFAATLAAAAPVYLVSLERLALNIEIDRLGRFQSKMLAFAYYVPLTPQQMTDTELAFVETVDDHLGEIYAGRRRLVTGIEFYADVPSLSVPPPHLAAGSAARATLRSLSDFDRHVAVVDGRLPRSQDPIDSESPILEAVIGPAAARQFGLQTGDILRVTPDPASSSIISVPIVGIVEPADPDADYWLPTSALYFRPEVPDPDDPGDGIYDPQIPPVPLLIEQGPLADVVHAAFPGTLSITIWTVDIDKDAMKQWTPDEVRAAFREFETQFALRMPGSAEITSGIVRMMAQFRTRAFFSRVPLLLLQAVMVASVLVFLAMMVSYLVRSRRADSALLRARGVSVAQLARVYALEGLVMTLLAVVVAPVLAVSVVASAGWLPFFRETTGGSLLPISLGPMPFVAAAGTGIVCLALYALPTAVGARGALLLHKFQASRPLSVSIIHRYYLDVGLLVLGGLIYWELYNRGQVLAGGLFRDIEVNEVLLLAPIVFLLVAGLLFLRVFPMVVRYAAGESPVLSHVLITLSLASLAVGITYRDLPDAPGAAWVGSLLILASIAAAYLFTARSSLVRYRIVGYLAQIGCILWFLSEEPIRTPDVLTAPTVLLAAIVPIQLSYGVFRTAARFAPASLSIGIRYVSRSPLQYSWLILLLAMVTGVGVLAATVGGTLDRSQTDQAQYDAGADVRVAVSDSFIFSQLSTDALLDSYREIPGVRTVSPAYRETRFDRPDGVELLAVDSREFPYLAWYREDFSEQPLTEVMRALNSHPSPERVVLPEDAVSIGLWAKLREPIDQLWVQVVLQEGSGNLTTLMLGQLWEPTEQESGGSGDGAAVIPQQQPAPPWKLLRRPLAPRIRHPVSIVSIQLYESRYGTLTPGVVLIDDIHIETANESSPVVLEDFEGLFRWTPIVTSRLALDRLYSFGGDAHAGDRSAMFRFGQEGQRGLRGIYLSPTGGGLPVVVSAGFKESAGVEVGDRILMNVGGRAVPAIVRSVIDHFPTMRPGHNGFILADLDAMLSHANVINPTPRLSPNEIFLSTSPPAHRSVVEQIQSMSFAPSSIYDRFSPVDTARFDPLARAGWTSMALVAVVIILITAAFGYVTYLLAFLERSRGELGFLRSLGFSNRQLIGFLAVEHLATLAIGICLGTWAGFQMSRMAVSSVVIVSPDDVLPPYTAITDWAFMLPTYIGLLAIILTAFAALLRSVRKIDLQTISRVEAP